MTVPRTGSGHVSVVMAEITAQMLMHSGVIYCMLLMVSMQAIPVLVLVLCESITSIPVSLLELKSFWHSASIREKFL